MPSLAQQRRDAREAFENLVAHIWINCPENRLALVMGLARSVAMRLTAIELYEYIVILKKDNHV